MNTDSLRLFVAVAGKLSFAAVAVDRDINPSSVSRAINQLENDLGVRLFHRTTRAMALTDAGATYLAYVRPVLEALDEASERVQRLQAGPVGTLRLTASVAFGERVLVPILAAFRKSFPAVELDLRFTDTNLDLVAEGIDLAVRLGARPQGDVTAARLFRTPYRIVASPEYLERTPALRVPDDLRRHRCTVFALPGHRATWRLRARDALAADIVSVAIDPDLQVSSALSLRSMVLRGSGPAMMADWLAGDDLAAGRLVDVLPQYEVSAGGFDAAAWFCYPTRRFLPEKVRAAIDFIRDRTTVYRDPR